MSYQAYTYSDVLIEPKYSEVSSRTLVDLGTKIGNTRLRMPVVSANMKNITGSKQAATIASFGGLGLLHRFCTINENVNMYTQAKQMMVDGLADIADINNIGVSIGVKEPEKERFEKLYEAGARVFCIDVAHGHHIHVKNMLRWVNNNLFQWTRGERGLVTLIAGNIATWEAYRDLIDWGADVAKVGIGPSPVCRTRYNTGVGVPQLYALERVYYSSLDAKTPIAIIADGGITHVGDIAKALKYADAVMIGSMISGTSETPGGVFRNEDNEFYKVYGGSTSGENKGDGNFVEGVIKTVPFKGHVKYILQEIKQGLQSAYSYVGASNHTEFQRMCELIPISGGARGESKI